MLTSLGREAARIVLPASCIICGEELPWRERRGSCCARCWSALPAVRGSRCGICGEHLDAPAGDAYRCGQCRERPPHYEWLESYGPYDGELGRLVQALKFDGHYFLAAPMAELLAAAMDRRSPFDVDVVTAVPMTAKRERARGYNQADLLGRELARLEGMPYRRTLLQRVRATRTQSELPRAERRKNVRGSFAASAEARGLSVLLVDDVCTTGETAAECARVLRRNGASAVYVVTVARA